MGRTFAWHGSAVSAEPYPVLWDGEVAGIPGSDFKRIVVDQHALTEEDERLLVSTNRPALEVLAEKYPAP